MSNYQQAEIFMDLLTQTIIWWFFNNLFNLEHPDTFLGLVEQTKQNKKPQKFCISNIYDTIVLVEF